MARILLTPMNLLIAYREMLRKQCQNSKCAKTCRADKTLPVLLQWRLVRKECRINLTQAVNARSSVGELLVPGSPSASASGALGTYASKLRFSYTFSRRSTFALDFRRARSVHASLIWR